MKASYIFSANDMLANAGVIVAGGLVALTGSRYPDLVVGAAIGLLGALWGGADSADQGVKKSCSPSSDPASRRSEAGRYIPLKSAGYTESNPSHRSLQRVTT